MSGMRGGGTRDRARRPSPWRQPPRVFLASLGLDPIQPQSLDETTLPASTQPGCSL